ncbi:MAG: Hsp20/alpha crystallin family protein [Cyclobacteriaceae bacterium]
MEDLIMTIAWKTRPGFYGYNRMHNLTRNENQGNVAANISKSDDQYRIDLMAPGRNKEKFSINLDKDVLEISYIDNETVESTDSSQPIHSEFELNGFKRRFYVPETIDREKISARYENGILSINVPYENPEKNRITKTITVN